MVGPPDSKHPPTAPAAEVHSDLTLNGPTSAADVDAVLDLRLEPDVDSLSTFVPEQAPLEQRDSVPPRALTQAEPTRVDIPESYIVWPVDDGDRSWWSRLRSLKASWGTKLLRRSAHDEQMATDADVPGLAARTGEVTMDAIRNLETHLASLAALRDACTSIDQRLARVEEVSRQRDHATIDEALHNLCSQMSDRLVRVEAAVQHTEGFVARLERVEAAVQRTEGAVADKTLHELCKNIDARLARTEETLHRREGIVTEWLQELSADMTARFAEAEEAIQRIERIVSSRTVEQIPSQQPAVRTDNSMRQAWMARLAVPALVLGTVLAIGALIETNRGVAPDNIVPLSTSDQVLAPAEQATNEVIRAVSTTAVKEEPSRSTRESPVSAPQQRSPDRKSAPTTSGSPRFVGTLSITSIPSGASVSINGKPAGVTPLRLSQQRAGSLAVQVAHDGFERWSAAVLVPADQLTQVTAKLRASAR